MHICISGLYSSSVKIPCRLEKIFVSKLIYKLRVMFSAYGILIPENEKLKVSDRYLLLTGLWDYLFSIFISLHSHKLVSD